QRVAANEPRGLFPRYLSGEQTYWTPVGSALGGDTQGLLNEDGMVEVDRGTFSIEPFLYVGERLLTWADGSPTQELEQGFLPIPSSVWRKDGIVLRATAFATGEAGKAVLYVRYRLENLEAEPRHVRFFAAADPALAPSSRGLDGAGQFEVAVREWSAKLARVDLRLPPTARAFSDTFRTAAAHILINRDGPALQPGPRRYARSWIRDGA